MKTRSIYKHIFRLGLVFFACFLPCAGSAAEEVTGEMLANPYFLDGNYDHWEFSGQWRSDGAQERIVFEMDNQNVGYPAAVGRGLHLALSDEEDASSAKLIGFEFNKPYLAVYNADVVSPNADYSLYFELDIVTSSGLYRAQSQFIKNPWTLQAGELALEFEWLQASEFEGAPASNAEGGIPIDTIQEVHYKAVIYARQATDSKTDPVFVTIDNMSLTFRVIIE